MPDDAPDCGCAPTAAERRAMWPSTVSRRGALGIGALGVLGLSVLAAAPAYAVTYPSWDDVEKARADEAAKAREVTRIQGLIQGLQAEVERTQALAEAAADEFYEAQQAYFAAAQRAAALQEQADEEAQKAADAAARAGRVAARLYRDGGSDTSLELFFSGSAASADDMLARLGTMDKLIERNQSVYADAVTARNSAQSLSDQAEVAREERDRLQQIAEQKMVEAQRAADAAEAALEAQKTHLADLEAQLAALQDTTAKTIAAYKAGVEAARKAKEEAERKAREEAERKAREEAEKSRNDDTGSTGGGSIVGSGWARPSNGSRSSGYGRRPLICGPSYCGSTYHYGVDLAPPCGAAIFAAHAGTVVYAGKSGGYGYYIKIDHGGGIGTGYAHIRRGGIFVHVGQHVRAGQHIAAVGNTGNSFGCHLHFETYVDDFPVNPTSFMAARGISV